jgi:phosphatidylglycerol:prolipoprotein diacylglycerol transferase
VFPADPASFAPPGIPLYPAQLMDGVSELAIFFGLVIFKRWKKFNGQLMAIYMIAYAIVRFVVEFFREPGSRNMIYGWFSAAQMVSLLMVVFALWIWIRNSKKERLEEKI